MTDKEADDSVFTLSTGVVLRLKKPPPYMLMQVYSDLEGDEPKPPLVMNENKGREEPNESDPDYVAAKVRFTAATSERVLNALIVSGTELDPESVPEAMFKPDTPDFEEWAAAAGLRLPDGRFARYREWVKHYAGGEDLNRLSTILFRLAGVSEEDVRLAQDMFPGLAPRGANNGSRPQQRRRVGNSKPTTRPRTRAKARRARGGNL